MSCIWLEQAPGQWLAQVLVGGRLLPAPGIGLIVIPGGAALLVQPGIRVRINGESVSGGLRILDHRDEILVDASRLIFSAQTAPLVTTFRLAEGQRLPICPICRGPVRDGMHAVACPGCGRWFHQLDAKPCWSYAPTCRFCQHPTSLNAETVWRPGEDDLD